MMKYTPGMPRNLQAAGLAVLGVLLVTSVASPFHRAPLPAMPAEYGGMLVRLVWLLGPGEPVPEGRVKIEAVELHRTDVARGESWINLPLLRQELSSRELIGGQVWVVNAPVAAGEFDQVRLRAGVGSQVPIALRLPRGQWNIVTLEVDLQPAPASGLLRLELRRAHTLGPS